VRWDRFFDDLEDQLASEWEAERAALDTEAERLRLSRVTLRERLTQLCAEGGAAPAVAVDFADGSSMRATVTAVGADWVAVVPAEGRSGAVLAPFASVSSIGMPHPDLLRSARPAAARPGLSDKLTFGYVLRDLVRRRAGVVVHLVTGRALSGTIDRAGADHFDLAVHEPGAPRRADAVTGHRIIPFPALAWIAVDSSSVLS
jgi:hypothetical protein